MLKKLAKYGNSTTLVIDKALLEILNMNESSTVKLHTDGKSLIITPVASPSDQKISYESHEALLTAVDTLNLKVIAQMSDAQKVYAQQQMPSMQLDFTKLFERNKIAMQKFSETVASKEFQEARDALAQKYDPITQAEEYVKEFNELKVQFCPEMAEIHKEMAEIGQRYAESQNKPA